MPTIFQIGSDHSSDGRMSEISSTIASAVEEQGAATKDISRNVQRAAETI
jgi:methyl-accepting chemotaxis protein